MRNTSRGEGESLIMALPARSVKTPGLSRSSPLENLRNTTYAEDASQIRAGNGPQAMATLRNLSIAILKLTGTPNIAAACRSHARDATRVLATLRLSTP
jgi:hypothetical protein